MTGEKNRFTTHEKLWKLDDKQLTSPKHDEMVLDLLDRGYMASVLKSNETMLPIYTENTTIKTVSFQDRWRYVDNDRRTYTVPCKEWMDQNSRPSDSFCEHLGKEMFKNNNGTGYRNDHTTVYPDYWKDSFEPPANEDSYSIEQVIKLWNLDRNDYIRYNTLPDGYLLKISSEVPLNNYNKFIIGYWDVVVEFPQVAGERGVYSFFDHINTVIYIEVKPIIASFGETLRQLNTYKNYLSESNGYGDRFRNHVCLYTYDTRFKDAFESQGITVLTPLR